MRFTTMANIFLLEDDKILSKGISIALKKDEHTVTAVYGYLEALQQYQKQKYDLFLLDINLPDGNGLEFCKKIRETSETPVLFLTANDTEEDMLEGFGVTNVLDNAVKYTPSGGVVDLKITEYPSYLRLDVSDNGIGIPEEEQAKIFGRFYRGKQSAGVDGVGIGLYLTRDIVNKQNGYIKVASDEKGTIFSLFLKKV